VTERFERLVGALGNRDLRTPDNDPELWRRVLKDVSAGRPFSLVRLGDGEGDVLLWGTRRDEYPALADFCVSVICRNQFGEAQHEGSRSRIFQGLQGAAVNTDYLAVPIPDDIELCLEEGERHENLESNRIDVRGLGGYLSVWDYLVSAMPSATLDRVTVTNRHIKVYFVKAFAELLKAAGNLWFITSYPGLLDRLHHLAGISEGETILIPPRALRQPPAPADAHFPSRYDEVMSMLSAADMSGKLVFVAAGVLGRHYCEQIRIQGGMAVDVGSTVDVWAGKVNRPWHTPDLVEQYRIL
jgi:hypothetical protein